MKTKHLLAVLLFPVFFNQLAIFAQVINPVIGFKNYKPKWIHLMFDSLNIDNTYNHEYDGLEGFNNPEYMEVDSFAYIRTHLRIKGMFLEKIDLKTGKKIWAADVSPDNWNEDFSEQASNFYINKDGNVELLTFRRIADDLFEDKSVFGRRIYNSVTGELLYEYHAPLDDTLYPHLIYSFPWNYNSKLYLAADGTYDYVSCHYINQEDHFFYYKLDSLGRELYHNEYFFPYDTGVVQHWYSSFKKFDDNTFAALKVSNNSKDYDNDSSKYWFSVDYFDEKFNLFKAIKLNKEFYYTKDRPDFLQVSKDLITVKNTYLNTWEIYYIFDGNGEMIDSIEAIADNGLPMLLGQAIVLNDGSLCIAGFTNNFKNKNITNQFCIYRVNLETKEKNSRCFDLSPGNHMLFARSLHITYNGDLLVNARHLYNKFDPNYSGWDGNYANWILFPGEDIGIKTATNEIALQNEKLKISPNPTSDKIIIDFENDGIVRYEVIDLFGRRIVSSISHEIDVSEFEAGIYFVQTFDENSKCIGIRKFVKH